MNPRRARRQRRTREHRLRSRVATAIDQAVRDVLPDLATHKIPRTKVNWGWCEEVADLAREHLARLGITATVVKDDDELRTTTHEIYGDGGWTHAWIWVEGKHHDAEAPHGARRWLDLPHFRRWLEPLSQVEKHDLGFEWGCVDITPVLSHGDEQRTLFRGARLMRCVLESIEKELVKTNAQHA